MSLTFSPQALARIKTRDEGRRADGPPRLRRDPLPATLGWRWPGFPHAPAQLLRQQPRRWQVVAFARGEVIRPNRRSA